MAGINKVIIVGRLGADPELKSVSSGQNYTRFNVATSESWVDKEGQKQERTEWHRVVVWGRLADICGKFLNKGRQVYVEGRLQTRSWDDPQGQKRYTTEIVANTVEFLDQRASVGGPGVSADMYSNMSSSPGGSAAGATSGYSSGYSSPGSSSSSSSYSGPGSGYSPEPSFSSSDDVPF